MPAEPIRVLALNCTLKRGNEASSTEKLLNDLLSELTKFGTRNEIVRVANLNILSGIKSDEGEGDEWPGLLEKIQQADIVVIGSPIWLGQLSSIAKRVLERMNAFLGEKDERQRTPAYNKIGIVAVVGNEDGAHHVAAEICAGMTEVGFTVPAGAATYWVGEALGSIDYKDLEQTPKRIAEWTKMLAANAHHLASAIRAQPYPGIDSGG